MTTEPSPSEPRTPSDSHEPEDPRPLHAAWAVLIGLVGAVVGVVPWLLTDMTLPLQNIWEDRNALPEAMPTALLPLSQYYLVASAAMVVVGAAFAGAIARLVSSRGRPVRMWLVVVSAIAVQGIALAQTTWALQGGLEDSSRARVYLYGMVAGICVAIAIGALVTVAIGKAGVAATTIAITVTALALTQWLPVLVNPIGELPTYDIDRPAIVREAQRWLPFVMVGAAVGWCGIETVRRALASVFSLMSLWVGSAAIVAFNYAIGSRIYLQNPSELIPAATDVFRMALTSFELPRHMAVTVVIAVIVAVIVAVMLYGLRRIDRRGDEGTAEPRATTSAP